MANNTKPEDTPKPTLVQKMQALMGGESSGNTVITWVIAIIGIILILLIGFLIYKRVTKSSTESFSETSTSNVPSTLTGTPTNYSATSNVTTTSV